MIDSNVIPMLKIAEGSGNPCIKNAIKNAHQQKIWNSHKYTKKQTKNDFNNPIVNAHCTFEPIFLSTEHISSQFQTHLSRNFVFLKHTLYILYVLVKTTGQDTEQILYVSNIIFPAIFL